MSTQDTAAFPVPADYRGLILKYASELLDLRDRTDSEAVTELAGPLLEWAGRASSKDDLQHRMEAMFRAHQNTALRRPRLTPAGFLKQVGAYYGFITG